MQAQTPLTAFDPWLHAFFGAGRGGALLADTVWARFPAAEVPPSDLTAVRYLIVGAGKSGTSWLFQAFRNHPAFARSGRKEFRFFDMEFLSRGLGEYAALFRDHPAAVPGEASPAYGQLPLWCLKRMAALMPEAKVLYLMRRPAAQLESSIKHCHRHREGPFLAARWPDKTLEDDKGDDAAIGHDLALAAATNDYLLSSMDYAGNLRRLTAAFGTARVKPVIFERMIDAPAATLDAIFDFLEVDDETAETLADIVPSGVVHGSPRDRRLNADLSDICEQVAAYRQILIETALRDDFGLDPSDYWAPPAGPFEERRIMDTGRREFVLTGGARPGLIGEREGAVDACFFPFDALLRRGNGAAPYRETAATPAADRRLERVFAAELIKTGIVSDETASPAGS